MDLSWRADDMTGQRFGRLTVMRKGWVERGKWRHQKQTKWECECDCGGYVEVYANNLRSGRTQSCGCLRKENARETAKRNFRHKPKEDLTGKTFGSLLVLRPSERKMPNRIPIWVTQCACGVVHEVRMDRLKSGKAKSCGCLRKRRDIQTSPDTIGNKPLN